MTFRVRALVHGLALAATIAAGCGGSGTDAPPTGSAPPPAGTFPSASDQGRLFEIDEVGLGSDGWLSLRNYTSEPANLGGLFICQGDACVELPSAAVAPGEDARITSGDGSGLDRVVMDRAGLDFSPADGEIALYSTADTGDASAIRAYLEWGSTPHPLSATAVRAGLWLEGSFAPTAADATRLFRSNSLWVFDGPSSR